VFLGAVEHEEIGGSLPGCSPRDAEPGEGMILDSRLTRWNTGLLCVSTASGLLPEFHDLVKCDGFR